MGLIVIDKEDDRIEAVTFENLDVDNDMTIIIDFKETDKESLSVYMTLSQVEDLKRHVDSELERLKQFFNFLYNVLANVKTKKMKKKTIFNLIPKKGTKVIKMIKQENGKYKFVENVC